MIRYKKLNENRGRNPRVGKPVYAQTQKGKTSILMDNSEIRSNALDFANNLGKLLLNQPLFSQHNFNVEIRDIRALATKAFAMVLKELTKCGIRSEVHTMTWNKRNWKIIEDQDSIILKGKEYTLYEDEEGVIPDNKPIELNYKGINFVLDYYVFDEEIEFSVEVTIPFAD